MTRLPRLTCGCGKVTLQEQAGPVVVARIRSSQMGDINSGRDAGGNSGRKGGGGRSTPNSADTYPWPGDDVLQERPQPVVRPPASSHINSGEMAGVSSESGLRGRSDRCTHSLGLTRCPWLAEVTPQDRPLPAARSPTPSSQKSDIKLVGNTGGGSGRRSGSDCHRTPTRADPLARRRSITRTAPIS